jgi:hypothetical protein
LEKSKIKGGKEMNYPDMYPVSSSNVAELGYDQKNQTVYVKFINGTLYTYSNVPENEYKALYNAPSIGSYLNRNFKNVYPYQRIG